MEQTGPQIAPQQPEDDGVISVSVDNKTAQLLKCQEFDKKIAEAEAAAADFKRQKATYIFESTVQFLALQYKQQQTVS